MYIYIYIKNVPPNASKLCSSHGSLQPAHRILIHERMFVSDIGTLSTSMALERGVRNCISKFIIISRIYFRVMRW